MSLDLICLREKGRVVEVVGSMEDDGGDEDGVDGQVLNAEPVQLRHVSAYRWAEKDY